MASAAPAASVAPPGAPRGQVFVGLFGAALLIAAVVGVYTGVTDSVVTVFAIIGGILIVVAPVLPRLEKLELSATGAKVEISPEEFAVAEYQAKKGQVIDPKAIGQVIEPKGIESSEAFGIPEVESAPPRVVLAEVAAEELALFNEAERKAIAEELPKVGSRDEHEYSLRWGIQPHEQYRVRRVGEDIRIFFRQREKTTVAEPDSFVVLGFQKAEPLDPGQERLGRIPFR